MDTVEDTEDQTFTPIHLRRWQPPEASYGGADWSDYYTFLLRTRLDHNDPLPESNWEYAIAQLARGNESCESETVRIAHFSHWGCGWVETIMIHHTDTEALRIADAMAGRLTNYPVLDEMDFCRRENDKCIQYWGTNPPSSGTLSDRMSYFRLVKPRYPDVSIFAVRNAWPPLRDHDEAQQYLQTILLE